MLLRTTVDFNRAVHAVETKLRQMPKHFAATGWFGVLEVWGLLRNCP